MQKVLVSAEFARSRRMARFLAFVVDETLAGRGPEIRERQIGVGVFDREPDWDPKLDNIVRSEARRLRQKLDAYYATAGVDDPVRIVVPKGSYAVEFAEVHTPAAALSNVIADPASHPLLPAAAEPDTGFGKRHRLFSLLSIATALALSLWLVGSRVGERPAEDRFEIVPLADEIGQEFDPALSPDGRRMAYVWDGNADNYDIYIKDLATNRLTRFTSDPAVELNPAWSPDASAIVFYRLHGPRADLVLRTVKDGAERILASTQTPVSTWLADSNPYFGCHGPAWSPDGRRIVVADQEEPGGGGYALFGVEVATGQRTALTKTEGEIHDTCPHFSPDGRSVAFVRYVSHGSSEVHVVSAQGGVDKQLTADMRPIRGLDWSADGRHIIYSQLRQGSFQLRQIEPHGGESELVPAITTSAIDPSVALHGDLLAFTEVQENWNLWRVRIDHESLGKPEMLIASTGKNHSPIYSPDGQLIAFVTDRSGSPEIWCADKDGKDLRQLTHFNGPWLGSIRFSPDGKFLTFDARPTGHSGIFTMPVAGGKPTPLWTNEFEERRPTWSADQRSIYFNSNRSGPLQIWKYSLADHSLIQIGPVDTNTSTESADGKSLYFTTNHQEFWRCDADGQHCASLPFRIRPEPTLDWTLARSGIYLAAQEGESPAFFYLSFLDHSVKRLGSPDRSFAPGTPSLAISPDGKWLLYSQLDHISSDIRMRRPLSK